MLTAFPKEKVNLTNLKSSGELETIEALVSLVSQGLPDVSSQHFLPGDEQCSLGAEKEFHVEGMKHAKLEGMMHVPCGRNGILSKRHGKGSRS